MDSPVTAVHGTLMEVFGTGVLLSGASGSGKSDLALGLVDRGHRLVADDQVEFVVAEGQLLGGCRTGCAGFIEVYGLGVVNLARLYGEQAVCQELPLGLVLSLETADDHRIKLSDRLFCQQRDWTLMGVSVRELLLPCGQGRNLPLLVETAVRLNRLWQQGYNGTAEFEACQIALMREGRA